MEILTAFLLASGILLLLWCAFGRFLLPACMEDLTAVWRLSGTAPQLEHRMRSIRRLQKSGFFPAKLLLVDCGLDPDARKQAELLTKEDFAIRLVSQEDLFAYFEVTRADHGTGI